MTKTRKHLAILLIILIIPSLGCGLAEPVIERVDEAIASVGEESTPTATRLRATPRPTFTPTPTPTETPPPTPTETPTPLPTATPEPTNTPAATNTPEPTATPEPTNTRRPANTPVPQPPTATFTPAPPTATPTPNWAFKVREQGDRMWQKTSNNQISNIALVSDSNGTPLGGYRIKGEHSSGRTYTSPPTSWRYDAVNGLEGYIKQGNVKVELGGFEDGTWYLWVVDSAGSQVSDRYPLNYSSNPDTWVWDFIWWSQ